MKVFLLVLEEVKWRGLGLWSSLRVSDEICDTTMHACVACTSDFVALSVITTWGIGQASRTWQLQSSGDCQYLKSLPWSILCFHWDRAVLSGMSPSFPIIFTSLQLCPETFRTVTWAPHNVCNPGGAGYSADLQQSSCCHDSSDFDTWHVSCTSRLLNCKGHMDC